MHNCSCDRFNVGYLGKKPMALVDKRILETTMVNSFSDKKVTIYNIEYIFRVFNYDLIRVN